MSSSKHVDKNSHRWLLDDVTWNRVANRIAKDHDDITPDHAEQILEATLAFLILCGKFRSRRFAPSEQVDIGWHTFLLYTKEYASFCRKHCRGFIHHSPHDVPGDDTVHSNAVDTLNFMRKHGATFDAEMWPEGGEGSRRLCGGCCGGH